MNFFFGFLSTLQIGINLFLFESNDLLLKFTELLIILFVNLFQQTKSRKLKQINMKMSVFKQTLYAFCVLRQNMTKKHKIISS